MNFGILSNEASIGARVRYYRELQNVSQERLAKWVGCSRTVLSKLECHDIMPGFETMIAIAKYLDMPISHVFRGSRYEFVLHDYTAEKTIITMDGVIKHFGIVFLNTDYNLDSSKYICVTDRNRKYLAGLGNFQHCTNFLCLTEDTGMCFVCTKSDDEYKNVNTGEIYKSPRMIAGIMEDITDFITPIVK